MAPKKKTYNAFSVFMMETQEKLASKGIKMNMVDMPNYCKDDWAKMSEEMKESYKLKGKKMKYEVEVKKYTSIGEAVDNVKQDSEDSKSQTHAMYLYIEELVRVDPIHYLPKQKFILIFINSYTCIKEGFYFPAEISMAEFSLEKGLTRIFHQLLGFDKARTNAPVAPTADINGHARNNHRIDTFTRFPNNYTDILLKIIGFIINQDVDEAVLNDPALDMPPIYTAHSSTKNELMTTSSSLYQLYQSAVRNASKNDFNNFLRVYHLDKLFMELKNVSHNIRYPNQNECAALPSVALASENLTKDMLNTIQSIGCSFHEKLENTHVCSNYYVCKWIYICATHCCQYYNIKLVPGNHYDFDLNTYLVETDFENLNIYKNDTPVYRCSKNKSQDLTMDSFPALKNDTSTIVQQPMWNKPENKVNTSDITTSDKDNFPPLGNPQQILPENTLNVNSWHTNKSRGKGIRSQVLKNGSNQMKNKDISSKKCEEK